MIILNLILVILFGYLLIGYIAPKMELVERLSLSFIVGIGLFTFIWFLLNLAGLEFSNLSIILILSSLIFLLRKNFGTLNFDKNYFKNLGIVEKMSITIIMFLFLSSFIGDIYWPVRHWDSLTLYDFRAKLFFETGFIKKSILDTSFFGYPLLTSLMHTFSYFSFNGNPSFIYNIFYISVVVNLFTNFKKLKINRLIVLLLTLSIAISPRIFDHSMSAYTNLPYLTYYLISSIYLFFFIKENNLKYLVISALTAGLGVWTRSTEPFYISQILVLLFFCLRSKKIKSFIIFGFILSIFVLTWRFFVLRFNTDISTIVAIPKEINFLTVFKSTSTFFITNFLKPYLSYLVLLFIVTIYKIKNKLNSWYFLAIIYLNLVMIFVGTWFFVSNYQAWNDISDSLTRMAMFIPPMVIFSLVQLLSKSRKGYNSKSYPK